jgi:hypothetical protein
VFEFRTNRISDVRQIRFELLKSSVGLRVANGDVALQALQMIARCSRSFGQSNQVSGQLGEPGLNRFRGSCANLGQATLVVCPERAQSGELLCRVGKLITEFCDDGTEAGGAFIDVASVLLDCVGAFVQPGEMRARDIEVLSNRSLSCVDFTSVLLDRVGAEIETAEVLSNVVEFPTEDSIAVVSFSRMLLGGVGAFLEGKQAAAGIIELARENRIAIIGFGRVPLGRVRAVIEAGEMVPRVGEFSRDNGVAFVDLARVLLPCVGALVQMCEAAVDALIRRGKAVTEFRNAPIAIAVVRFERVHALVCAPGVFCKSCQVGSGATQLASDNDIPLIHFA